MVDLGRRPVVNLAEIFRN